MTILSPRSQLLFSLWLASQRVAAKADQSLGAVHGIALVEFIVLAQLADAHEGRMRRVDLAQAVGRSPSGVTRLLRPMEKIGLVARESNERDARVSLVRITPAGKERLGNARASLEALAERLTSRIAPAQVEAAQGALSQLAQ